MIRTMVISLITAAAMAVIPAIGLLAAEPDANPHMIACLKKSAEMNQAKITLGQLAGDRGANPRIRQFGLQMAGAHKRLNEEVQGLAATKGVPLPSELNEEHKQRVRELSKLTGHAFDREYMAYILRDHQSAVNEFEEHMQLVEDPDVLHWMARTLPLLRFNVEDARWTKNAMQTNP